MRPKRLALLLLSLLLVSPGLTSLRAERFPVEAKREQLQMYRGAVKNWGLMEDTQLLITVAVILFGTSITVIQGLEKGWTKRATLFLGTATTVLTGLSTKLFEADYRTYGQAVVQGTHILNQMTDVLENASDPNADQSGLVELWGKWDTEFSGLQNRMFGQGQVEAVAQSSLVPAVYAQGGEPAWFNRPPSDPYNYYFAGSSISESLSQAEQASREDAVRTGSETIARARPGADFLALASRIRVSSVIADTSFSFDRQGRRYRVYTLLRLSRNTVAN